MNRYFIRVAHKGFKNNTDGFTLIEIILSIVILAFVSVVVIQLFMASKDLGSKAKKIDLATISAANAIEVIKSLDNPADMKEHEFFRQANQDIDGNQVVYYNEDFAVSVEALAVYIMEVKVAPDNKYLTLVVDEYFDAEGRALISTVYDIEVMVSVIETGDTITNQVSSHYYTFVR